MGLLQSFTTLLDFKNYLFKALFISSFDLIIRKLGHQVGWLILASWALI